MNAERLPRAAVPGSGSAAERGAWIGVAGIDELLPSGLRHETQIMCTGDTGVGKTVLAAQFLYEGLLVGDSCVYVACDEPPDQMRANMAALRIGTLAYERAGRLLFVDAYARERSKERHVVLSPNDLDEYFAAERAAVEAAGRERPVRLAADSLSTICGTGEPAAVLEFNRDRLRYFVARGVFALDNYVTGLLDDRTLAGLSHAYPLIVKLGYVEGERDQHRVLQLGKLRSGMFSGERRVFRIDRRAGIVVQR